MSYADRSRGRAVIATLTVSLAAIVLTISLLALNTELLAPTPLDTTEMQYGRGLSLLVTQHGAPSTHNNIVVYRRHSIGASRVKWGVSGYGLEGSSVAGLKLRNLRGMLHNGDRLLFTAAHTSSSRILDAPACTSSPRKAHVFAVHHLSHPYAIAARGHDLYVTNQNSNTVVRFDAGASLAHQPHNESSEPPGVVVAEVSSPRGLAFADDTLFVASTNEGLLYFDDVPAAGSGGLALLKRSGSFDEGLLPHPIGVVLDEESGLLFVGSVYNAEKGKRKRANGGGVHVLDPRSKEVVRVLRPPPPHRLDHPAGIAVADRTLFVVAQSCEVVLAWDLRDFSFIGVAIDKLPPKPEQLLALRCLEE